MRSAVLKGCSKVVQYPGPAPCAWQTFFILVHDTRFREMGIEYAEYTVILLFLFFSDHARQRFGSSPAAA